MRKSKVKAIYRHCMLAGLLVISLLTLSPGFLHAQATYAAPADMSNGNIQWPQGQTLPTFAHPHHLDVVNLTDDSSNLSLMFATLEGIVNRQEPRIYLIEHLPGQVPDEGTSTWLNDMKVPYTVHTDPWQVLDTYIREVRGVIIYDPALMDTINIATTLAGLQNGIVVSPDLAQKVTAAPYNLPVLKDLRGKFSNSLAAYTWEYQNLWPQTTHRMLIGLPALNKKASFGFLRDYAVANQAMVFWTRTSNAQSMHLFDQILSSVPPATPYLGWFDSEVAGVGEASKHGVRVLASDWFSNMTVFSGIPAPLHQQPMRAAPPLARKIYITFTVSDGDNLQYDEHYMRKTWDDPDRGQVPLNWTIDPLIVDAAPMILNHYQQTATSKDWIIAGPSGAGYFYPSMWPRNSLSNFFQQSELSMSRAGLTSVYALDAQATTLPDYIAQAYHDQMHLDGLFLLNNNSTPQTTLMAQDLPVARMFWANTRASALQELQQVSAGWDGNAPLFVSILLNGWSDPPADATYLVQKLNTNCVVVRGDQFFQLFREANG
jgi:hypothetical protein